MKRPENMSAGDAIVFDSKPMKAALKMIEELQDRIKELENKMELILPTVN